MPQGSPSFAYSGFKVFAVLLIIIAMILFIAYILRKANIMGNRIVGGENFNIISRFPLGERKYLYLVKIGKELILLGVTPQNISFIKEIEEDTLESEYKKEESNFLKILKSKVRGRGK